MSTIDELDRVVAIAGGPQPSIGAPIPSIVSYERHVVAESLSAAEREGPITGAMLEMVRQLGERWGDSG